MVLPDAAGPSTAMIRRPEPLTARPVSMRAPSRFISAANPGKLVSIVSAPLDRDRRQGESAKHQEAHRDAMVVARLDLAPPGGGPPQPCTTKLSLADLDPHPAGAQTLGDRAQADRSP